MRSLTEGRFPTGFSLGIMVKELTILSEKRKTEAGNSLG
jgi:hypothetical protein